MRPLAYALPLLAALPLAAQQLPPPIVDAHLHARSAPSADREQPPRLCYPVTRHDLVAADCPEPLLAPTSDEAMVAAVVEILERRNVLGVISGHTKEVVHRFVAAAPDRLIPAYQLDLGDEEDVPLPPAELRALLEAGVYEVLGEIGNQYFGIAPDDPRMEPYWSLAEELGIPVAVHLGEGYPGAPYLGSPGYRVRFGSPLLLEEVLVEHPDLRLYVMHYGSPLVDEMIAILYTYPQVYVDVGSNVWHYPREYFYSQLRRLVDAGFGRRILFGSDQMYWPQLIEISIAVIEEAPFLSDEQKRDILYGNAARFFRFSDEEIARHHGRQP